MSARQRLPNRRGSATFNLEVGGLTFTATASKFADGSLGEVFIQNHKADSTAGVMANDASIAASLALQYGCPLDTLRKALKRDGREHALGPLGVALDMLSTERKDTTNMADTFHQFYKTESGRYGIYFFVWETSPNSSVQSGPCVCRVPTVEGAWPKILHRDVETTERAGELARQLDASPD